MVSFQKDKTNSSQFLRAAHSEEFLPPISRWTTLSGLFLVGTVGAAVTLASCIKYNVTLKAPATVRPAGEVRIVQAQSEGTVDSIEVEENQLVQRGDVIARIDNSQLQTQASQLKESIKNSQLQLAQIDDQVRALDRQILAETNRINGAVASAQAELEQAQRDYQDKQVTIKAQVHEAQANVRLAQEEVHQAQTELTSAIANLKSNEAARAAAQSKQNRYQPIAEAGAISRERLEEAELEAQQQQQAFEAQQAVVEGQKQTIERQKQAVEAARARLDSALAGLNPSAATVAIASERIAQAQAQGEATLANLKQERIALNQRRAEIQKQRGYDQKEWQQTQSELKHSVLRATSDGVILKLDLRNSGQVVHPSDAIAQIAPGGALMIKAQVSPQNIDQVAVGQSVQLRVSACPYPDYGTLAGTVQAVSPDAISPQDENNARYFEATIKPQNLALIRGDRSCRIQAGMDAKADIISKEETALQFLLRKARLLTDL